MGRGKFKSKIHPFQIALSLVLLVGLAGCDFSDPNTQAALGALSGLGQAATPMPGRGMGAGTAMFMTSGDVATGTQQGVQQAQQFQESNQMLANQINPSASNVSVPDNLELHAAYCLGYFQGYVGILSAQVPESVPNHDAIAKTNQIIALDYSSKVTHLQRYLISRGAFEADTTGSTTGVVLAYAQAEEDWKKEFSTGPDTPYYQCAKKNCTSGSVSQVMACREKKCSQLRTDIETHQESCWSIESELPF